MSLKNYERPSLTTDMVLFRVKDNENNNSRKISLNIATQATLDTLPGIGEVFSKRIIEYRTVNGGFKTIEELKKVKGVGESLYESLKDLVCL